MLSHVSKTVLHQPRRIEVTSDEAVFRQFSLSWLFEPQPESDCRARLTVEFELRSRLLQALVEHVLSGVITDIITALEARASALRGTAYAKRRHRATRLNRCIRMLLPPKLSFQRLAAHV